MEGFRAGPGSYDWVKEIMQTEGVRKRIADAADRKARAAQQIAEQEGRTVSVVRSNGTRPKGRPYARISIPASDEHGNSKVSRLRLLGRVLNGR